MNTPAVTNVSFLGPQLGKASAGWWLVWALSWFVWLVDFRVAKAGAVPRPGMEPQSNRTAFDLSLPRDFATPPQRYWPRPLWFWNNTRVTAETVRDQMRLARDRCRYGGFGILPFGKSFAPAYLSDEYFALYGAALEQAKALGLTLSLYDEYGFPAARQDRRTPATRVCLRSDGRS